MAGDDLDPDDELEIDDPVEQVTDLEDKSTDPVDEPEDQPEPAAAQSEATDQQQAAAPSDRQPSRRDSRIQTLIEASRQKDTEMADLRRRLDDLSRQQIQPQGESPEQRAQRFALMTSEERMEARLVEAQTRHDQQMQSMQYQTWETSDRMGFQAKAAVDPLYAKWGPKVEAYRAEQAAKGQSPVERDIVMAYLIGKSALERRGSKEGKRETQQAQRRVAAQRVRPANSGSDTSSQRRSGTVSLERRLENVQI